MTITLVTDHGKGELKLECLSSTECFQTPSTPMMLDFQIMTFKKFNNLYFLIVLNYSIYIFASLKTTP